MTNIAKYSLQTVIHADHNGNEIYRSVNVSLYESSGICITVTTGLHIQVGHIYLLGNHYRSIGKGRTRDVALDVHTRYLYIAYFDYDRASEKEVGNLIFCKSNKLA